MDGIVLIDKPEGITSTAVVRTVKALLRCKVGHLGTLDPFASGLLPLVVGEGTKIAQFLNTADKSYSGVIRLGSRTDTGDRTGTVVEEKPFPRSPAPERCAQIAAEFRGQRQQVPPMYSAVKQAGVPLYKHARRGIDVERAARNVIIHSLILERIAEDRIGIQVSCSKGTYVRVLAEEIAAALGTVGHLEALRREGFGRFRLEDGISLPTTPEMLAKALLSPREALADLAEVEVTSEHAVQIRQGRAAALRDLREPPSSDAVLKLVGPDGFLLAVVVASKGEWRFARVMC